MTAFQPDPSSFSHLKDKSIVISGGATGIGAATVKLLARAGARVTIGDVKEQAAQELIAHCADTYSNPHISFENCDVRSHDDIYSLFRVALDRHSRVDHAIACAGIFENPVENFIDPDATIQSIGDGNPGDTSVIDVNVLGTLRFSRVAVVFMRGEDDGVEPTPNAHNKSLTLLSSVNAFRDSPGLYTYQTSKHAIQGFMRAARTPVYRDCRVRVNCVCPGMTETPMSEGLVERFKTDEGLFWQTAESVGNVVCQVLVEAGFNGKSLYVEGGDAWEFEEGLYESQEQWLGKEGTKRLRANAEAVNKGALTGG